MATIAENIKIIQSALLGFSNTKLIAVTKMRTLDQLVELYETGQRVFGENKVQELVPKFEALPKDIEWHLIGHLQSNKVKYIASFISTIHSIDSFKLLEEVNRQAAKNQRVINCLLQIYIAKEESKFGLDESEALGILKSNELELLTNIKIVGIMGMATNTPDERIIRNEFKSLKIFFESIKSIKSKNVQLEEISMGMSNDFVMAAEEGSTMVRIGSAVFA